MTLIADHSSERIGQRHAEKEDQQHLEDAGHGGRVFERMRRVDVEEAATIATQQLDRLLRGHRTTCQNLLSALQCRRADITTEGLRHALPDQEKPCCHADRQQDIECDARNIDPEVADRPRGAARKAAHQRDRHGDTGRGGKERLHCDARHLREVAERGLTTIGLPACVRGEAHRCVQRQVWRNGIELLRIERKEILRALYNVQHDDTDKVEAEQREGIADPALFVGRIDTGQTIQAVLDRRENAPHLAVRRRCCAPCSHPAASPPP